MKLLNFSQENESLTMMADNKPKPRCLATLPNNIEELIEQFKAQERKFSDKPLMDENLRKPTTQN